MFENHPPLVVLRQRRQHPLGPRNVELANVGYLVLAQQPAVGRSLPASIGSLGQATRRPVPRRLRQVTGTLPGRLFRPRLAGQTVTTHAPGRFRQLLPPNNLFRRRLDRSAVPGSSQCRQRHHQLHPLGVVEPEHRHPVIAIDPRWFLQPGPEPLHRPSSSHAGQFRPGLGRSTAHRIDPMARQATGRFQQLKAGLSCFFGIGFLQLHRHQQVWLFTG